jgi:hypothetical protein
MPIDMFTRKVSNPVSRKRSIQQIMLEEDEFDNSPWNDEYDAAPARGNHAGASRAVVKTRTAASRVSKTSTAKTKVVAAKGRGKTKVVEDDPIELDDETDIEEILDDDDDMPLAVSMAKKKPTRKEPGLAARGKGTPGKTLAKSVEAPWAAFKATGSSTSGEVKGTAAVSIQEIEEMSYARRENATPCERLYDSLQAVYQGVSCLRVCEKVCEKEALTVDHQEKPESAQNRERHVADDISHDARQ